MEIAEAKTAMKSSYSTEMEVKNANQGVGITEEDIWCVTGLPGGDEFSIDEFFNLTNEEEDGNLIYEDEEEREPEEFESFSSSSHDPVQDSGHFSTQLAIPDVDMQELELWSHLMNDSVPEATLACLKPIMEAHHKKIGYSYLNRVEPYTKQGIVRVSVFPTAVPVKPRSKRPRTVVNRTWFTGSPPKTASSSSSSPPSPVSTLLFAPPAHPMGMCFTYGLPIPPMKKPKKKPSSSVDGEMGLNPSVQRRCTHCQVTKTPQWRAGPNGPKTLCNACGVRFKSGRLFPEYRPSCSPTFSSKVHSNSHRKVLEMRRKKETAEPFTGSVQSILSS